MAATVLLLATGTVPGLAAQREATEYLDTAGMMVYPHDIEEAEIGAMCVAVSATHSVADGGQEMMDAFLAFERRQEAEEIIADLVDDGDVTSIVTMTSNADCPNLNLAPSEIFHSVQSTVFVQDRRGGARDMFDLLADESLYLDGADLEEWEALEAPNLGDEADLDLRWSLDDGERNYWKSVVLTVRVDRLVGQVTLGSTWSSSREPDLDSILQLGELMVDRMEQGLDSDGTPGATLVRLDDTDDGDQLSMIQMTVDQYVVFSGAITRGNGVTEAALEKAQAVVDERGYSSRFIREYAIDNGEEILGYVLLSYYQFDRKADARRDLDTRLESLSESNPENEIEELETDVAWGDGSLAVVMTEETEDGGPQDSYLGYVGVGEDLAYIQVIPGSEAVDPEALFTLLGFQEDCMQSRTGCDGPLDVAEVFG